MLADLNHDNPPVDSIGEVCGRIGVSFYHQEEQDVEKDERLYDSGRDDAHRAQGISKGNLYIRLMLGLDLSGRTV